MPSLTRAVIAAALLSLLAAYAQTPAPEVERTFALTAAKSPQDAGNLANLIRVIGDIPQVSLAGDGGVISVRATSSKISLAGWFVAELDNPAPQSLVVRSFPVPGGADDVARIIHLGKVHSPQSAQEIVNATRTLGDVQRMFPYGQSAVALRGTAAQADLVEWLVRALIDPGAQTSNPAVYEYRPSAAQLTPVALARVSASSAVRVFHLKHAATAQALQEIVNATRTIADCQRLMLYTQGNGIALRAEPWQAALAEWLISELDKPVTPAGDPAPHEYVLPGSTEVVRIVHPPVRTAQELQALANRMRTAGGVQRLMPCASQGAIAFRGTVSQANLAELAMR